MAKILIFNVPAYGHVNVTIPLTHELVERRHEVTYYCTEQFRSVLKPTGADFRAYPDTQLSSGSFSNLARNLASVSVMLTDVSQILTPFVIDEIEREQPDLIIYDNINLWARIGAVVTNMPSVVTHSVMIIEEAEGLLDLRSGLTMLLHALPKVPALLWNRRKLTQTYGNEPVAFPLFPSRGDLNLVFLSREFQVETPFIDDTFQFVGASINPDLRSEPPLELEKDSHPLIYISLGTVNNDNLQFYQQVLETFADENVQVILSVGKQINIADLGRIPENFRVFASVPQLQVLEQADVFVTHGGMNSVQEAIYYGVPMVVVPQQIEQMINGRRVRDLGIGKVIGDIPPYGRVDIDLLKKSVNEVLSNPQYQAQIDLQQNASHDAGGYQRAVDAIETQLTLQSPQFNAVL